MLQDHDDFLETGVRKGKILEPLLIGKCKSENEVLYILRAYDAFLPIGENLISALEILIKFFYILKIKGSKNIGMFKSFWQQCLRIEPPNELTSSLLNKLDA